MFDLMHEFSSVKTFVQKASKYKLQEILFLIASVC